MGATNTFTCATFVFGEYQTVQLAAVIIAMNARIYEYRYVSVIGDQIKSIENLPKITVVISTHSNGEGLSAMRTSFIHFMG